MESSTVTMQEHFGTVADDFFVLCILAKATPETSNRALPWIFAHILELALKACCLKLAMPSTGHNLNKLWGQIKSEFTENDIWPEEKHFEMYKNVFIRGNVANPTISGLPIPEELYRAELAYWIDNVRDLKYGFDLKASLVSLVHISYQGLNPAFLKLFKNLRDKYKTPSADKYYINKVKSLFPEPNFQEKTIQLLVN